MYLYTCTCTCTCTHVHVVTCALPSGEQSPVFPAEQHASHHQKPSAAASAHGSPSPTEQASPATRVSHCVAACPWSGRVRRWQGVGRSLGKRSRCIGVHRKWTVLSSATLRRSPDLNGCKGCSVCNNNYYTRDTQ